MGYRAGSSTQHSRDYSVMSNLMKVRLLDVLSACGLFWSTASWRPMVLPLLRSILKLMLRQSRPLPCSHRQALRRQAEWAAVVETAYPDAPDANLERTRFRSAPASVQFCPLAPSVACLKCRRGLVMRKNRTIFDRVRETPAPTAGVGHNQSPESEDCSVDFAAAFPFEKPWDKR